jgi:predicted amidophosphoribosyltransferase
VGLSQRERQQNLADAFQAKGLENQDILLVDDICTTGSTLLACAQALQSGGAKSVRAITVARAIFPASKVLPI